MSSAKNNSADNELIEDTTKKSNFKKILMLALGAIALIGASVGAGFFFGLGQTSLEKKVDPNRPMLVLRIEGEEESEEVGEEGGEPAMKVGTVSVVNDRQKVDPKKYEVTYFPIEQQFTANLADGENFVQIGLSLATFYDGRMIRNIKRQMVPIRSSVLAILSTQNAEVISAPEGREMLQRQLARAINDVLREKEGFGGIDSVYITSMVIQ